MVPLTTTAGAFPKPRALRRARWRFAEGEIDAAALREEEDRALGDVLRLQTELGLDLLVDGQMDREDIVSFVAGRLEGVDPGGLVRIFGNRYYRRPQVVDAIERTAPLTVERWTQAGKLAGRPVRAVITGPYTLMDWSFDAHYGSREACCRAFAAAIRDEVADLVVAGAGEIQLDEPALGVRPDELGLIAEVMAELREAASAARIWLRLCYGEYRPVLPAILALPVDVVMLDLANAEANADELVAGWPDDKLLGAGVVDVLTPECEGVERVRARIERLLEALPASRLVVAPDAGLNTVDATQARAKLAEMVQAARSLG